MTEVPVTVFSADAAVAFDSLPVAQLRYFSDPLGSDWPFVQARFAALENRALLLQVLAYEVGKPADSRLCVALGDLCVEASPAASTALLQGAESQPLAVRVTPVEGDDLQGDFWGIQLYVPAAVLRLAHPGFTLSVGQTLPCRVTRYTAGSTHGTAALFDGNTSGLLCFTAY